VMPSLLGPSRDLVLIGLFSWKKVTRFRHSVRQLLTSKLLLTAKQLLTAKLLPNAKLLPPPPMSVPDTLGGKPKQGPSQLQRTADENAVFCLLRLRSIGPPATHRNGTQPTVRRQQNGVK